MVIDPEPHDSWSTWRFLQDVFLVYRQAPGVFLRLLAPALFFGFAAVLGSQYLADRMFSRLPRGPEILEHNWELATIWLTRIAGWFVSWIGYCFAFAALAVAVREIRAERPAYFDDCFEAARFRMGSLLRLSTLLFVIYVVLFTILNLALMYGSVYLPPLSDWEFWWLGVIAWGLAALIVARFGLAIPALVLDGCGVAASMFRSDEYTKRRWLALLGLVVESLGLVLLAFFIPRWLAEAILPADAFSETTDWILWGIGFLGAALAQPGMFIGFALLYLGEHERRNRDSSAAAYFSA